MVHKLLKYHEFWRIKGLRVDLVLLVEDEFGYSQPLQDSIREAVFASHARDLLNRAAGVFILNANQMSKEEKRLFYTVARLIIRGEGGAIADQLEATETGVIVPQLTPQGGPLADRPTPVNQIKPDPCQLLYYNGIGGFSQQHSEYVICLQDGCSSPAPWINVIANPGFGFNISEVGAGYTWAENSRENKLTPWYNDPVTDMLGEVFYLRDESSGRFWSLTPMPVREKEDYVIRHGKGYTSFEHCSHGLEQKLTVLAALEHPVKIGLVQLVNQTSQPRELSLTYYLRPVMGVNEKVNAPYIISQLDASGVLLLTNCYNSDFPGRVAFVACSEAVAAVTGDNREFIGIKGSLEQPAAMTRQQLSGRLGGGLDPCAAIQIKLTIQPQQTQRVVFLLGQGQDRQEALAIASRFASVTAAEQELAQITGFWEQKLGVIEVQTPDKSMDILLNSWLQYQVIACRLWSRAAYYQSGGAYGFRDQLQDVMAVAYSWPELTRRQILLHSAHQFIEGDVQHWWHPGVNKGIRTRYSDDYLWLPYVTADYIQCTADWSLLEEVTGFVEADPLPAHEDERYDIPRVSEEQATVYEHCLRAIDNGLRFGEHGLPLMGSGDWNDGMNTVGNQGKGESVWLGWFLYTVLQKFIPICRAKQDEHRAKQYTQTAAALAEAIEKHAWDGSWYLRAYFDDGKPLGSAHNTECKIDAIAQAWSVISGIGRPHRAEEAMQAVENHLIDREAGIIKLLTPPFGAGDLEPGYIKGYVPGVRENGGQYTHAAVWVIMAYAKLGQGDKSWQFFDLINPINHARTMKDCMRYKVEPYVMAADVYAVHPNSGRGGWSWYTGAAGWMYRVGIEHLLGIKKVGNTLVIDPCIPRDWGGFEVHYRLPGSLYRIVVQNPDRVNTGVKKVLLNGQEAGSGVINLVDDGKEHIVQVIMGPVAVGSLAAM
ncbi:MAG TPA: hypothetical protein VHS59_00340 [Bacillota bacterium]|nr:hypothetical protein [Bacillota bacterium]